MPEQIGTHLLGRRPMPPDPKDFQLADYLESRRAVASAFTPDMRLSDVASSGLISVWHDVYGFWHWFDETFLAHKPQPAPSPGPVTPGPVSPAAAVMWVDAEFVSDQGDTPHCVGFTGLDWLNTLPVDDARPNPYGHDLYYLCEPQDKAKPVDQQQGSDSRALCKVLKGQGRIGAYAFTVDAGVVRDYVVAHGSVGTGVPWDRPMFAPDDHFYLHPDASKEEGGHELNVVGYSESGYRGVSEPSFCLLNHWQGSWGDGGRAYITLRDYQSLLDRQGDAWAGLELPLAASAGRLAPRAS